MSNTKSVTIGQSTYPTIRVGDHIFLTIAVEEFCKLPPAPVQRNSHLRVPKMKSIFDGAYMAGQSATLTEVAIGIVSEDFEDRDPTTGAVISKYTKGEVSIIDGNTRKHYWLSNHDKVVPLTEGLTAKVHFLKNMEDVKFAYYPYNSKDSVEKTTEILQGLARRYNWQPRQALFANGNYKTAIDWACTGPADKVPSVFESFNHSFEELKILESIPKGSGLPVSKPILRCLKSQPIFAAYLIAIKLYPNNLKLFDFIEKLSSLTEQDVRDAIARGDVGPIEIVAIEWLGWSRQRGTSTTTTWLNEMAGSTNFASKEPQLDFLLYWIFEYISNPSVKYDFNKGVRPSQWIGTWKELYDQ
jgi:hypothetical protein